MQLECYQHILNNIQVCSDYTHQFRFVKPHENISKDREKPWILHKFDYKIDRKKEI